MSSPASASGILASKKVEKKGKKAVSIRYEKVEDPEAGGSSILSEVHVSLKFMHQTTSNNYILE